jgi:pimeloyl-ACP methyl ester carboxylesterase
MNLAELLFLPGASGNIRFWKPVADGLRSSGTRRFFGWPGFGTEPSDPAVRGLGDLVQLVKRELTLPAALFAQSMGGVVALQAALEKPDYVKHLVLSATSGGIDLTPLGATDWRPAFRAHNPTLPTWFEDAHEDLTPRLRELTMPVLLLWGDADPISPVTVGERLAELLPNAELVVFAGGNHDLIWERAGEVIPHIERHLSRVAGAND